MVLIFFTSYMSHGEHVFEPKRTALHYLKTTFLFDLILTIPVDVFVWSSVWLHCLLRIPRMLRVFKVPYYFEHLERQSTRPYIFTLAKVLGGAIAITHVFACSYFALAYHEGFGKTRFVPPLEWQTAPLREQYLLGFWWATNVITRVGGSVQGPATPLEQGLMIPVAFFTLFFVALVIGGVSEVLNRMGDSISRFRRRVEAVKTYMLAKHIPKKLRQRVKEYYDHLWARGDGNDDAAVLRDLPSHLRSEVSVFVNGEIVPKVPFFAHCSAGFIKAVVAHLKPHMFAPGDWVVREGDAGSDMFFISRGKIIISSATGEVLSVLGEGDFFGEICLLIDTQRTASARAATYCDLLSLDKKALSSVLEHFPGERPILQELAETRIGHDFLRNLLYCEPLFMNCSKSFINFLSDSFKLKRYAKGQMVYQSGTTLDSDSVFFVSSGSLIIEEDNYDSLKSSKHQGSEKTTTKVKSKKSSSAVPPTDSTTRGVLIDINESGETNRDETDSSDSDEGQQDSIQKKSEMESENGASAKLNKTPIASSNNKPMILQEGSFDGLLELLVTVVDQLRPNRTFRRSFSAYGSEKLDMGAFRDDKKYVPLESTVNLQSTRGYSLRANSHNTLVLVLKKRDFLEILYDPEFVGQLPLLEQSTVEVREREALKEKIERDRISRRRTKDQEMSQTNNDSTGHDLSPDLHLDSIAAVSSSKGGSGNVVPILARGGTLAGRGMLKKQMSAFLQNPIENAKEIMRAKQRSAHLAKKISEGSPMSHSTSSTANSKETSVSRSSSSSDHNLNASSSSVSAAAQLFANLGEIAPNVEQAIVNATFGGTRHSFADLDQSDTLKMLQAVNAMQNLLIAKLAQPQ